MTEAAPQVPAHDAPRRADPAPGSGAGTALLTVGIILFIGGWVLIGAAPSLSTISSLLSDDIVNTPSLVQKSSGGLMVCGLGSVLFVGGLIVRRIDAWGHWLHTHR